MNFLKSLSRWWENPSEQRWQRYCQRANTLPESRIMKTTDPVEIFRDSNGNVQHVRIGCWRVIAASGIRRIVEVRRLANCQRVVVQIELSDADSSDPTCSIWELYDLQGSLLAMLQTSEMQGFCISTDFQTGQISRLELADAVGLAKSVESANPAQTNWHCQIAS